MLNLMKAYRQANRARQIGADSVKAAEDSLQSVRTRSKAKDKPILALAKAADVLVLCAEDKKLKEDFVDPELLPRTGPQRRAVYPIDADQPTQRQFLSKRRCTNPRCS